MLDASPYRYNNIDKIIQSEHVNMRIIFQIIIVYENYHYSYKLFNNGIQWMMKYRQRDDEMSGLFVFISIIRVFVKLFQSLEHYIFIFERQSMNTYNMRLLQTCLSVLRVMTKIIHPIIFLRVA